MASETEVPAIVLGALEAFNWPGNSGLMIRSVRTDVLGGTVHWRAMDWLDERGYIREWGHDGRGRCLFELTESATASSSSWSRRPGLAGSPTTRPPPVGAPCPPGRPG